MKSDNNNKEIMDYVDGISEEIKDEKMLQEAIGLKKLRSDLKRMPLEPVSDSTDIRMQQFIQHENKISGPVRKIKKPWPYIAVAASVVLLIFVFNQGTSLEAHYGALKSNPDKLSFIYNLNDQRLKSEDIQWLKGELASEVNPNIKVTIVDLLNNYEAQLDNEFYKNLLQESVPSVQMALLNSVENITEPNLREELQLFSGRADLDETVRTRAMKILSNQSK